MTNSKRYSVLTFIFGGYEKVREISVIDPDAEYILVTDDPGLKSSTWEVICDSRLENMGIIDRCYYVRYHPFEYCHTDICFKIDGSIQVKESLSGIIDSFEEKRADMMVMLNPMHTRLHEDYRRWVKTRGYGQDDAGRAMKMLKRLGYSRFYRGYYQICVSIERKNKHTSDFDSITYNLLRYMGKDGAIERFDQPVYSFVLNSLFSDRMNVMPVQETLITNSKYLQWCIHNSDEAIPMKKKMKRPFLFNRLADCVDFSLK